jgi:hypothetical protein
MSVPCILAQSHTEYNVLGDQALAAKDYYGARTRYSEGLESCDLYSINQLTVIWKEREDMQKSMNIRTMSLCYRCIKSLVEEERRPAAMLLLSEYYKLGIGVKVNQDTADYWLSEYVASLGLPSIENKTDSLDLTPESKVIEEKKKKNLFSDKFYSFFTYTYSPTMPFGVSIGGFYKYGLYVSYRMSEKRNYDFECNNNQVINTNLITDIKPLYRFDQEDWTAKMITGGILLPVKKEKIYLSVGGGYAERNYFRSIISEEIIINNSNSAWCHNTEVSYKSFVTEIGGLWKWRRLVVAGGVNSTGFKDLDIYFSLGISF